MDNLVLLLCLESEIVLKKLLEACVAVIFDLLLNHTSQVTELTRHDSTTTVALAARKTFLVDLRAVALEARHRLNALSIVLITRDKQVTGNVHVLDLDLHLGSLVLHLSQQTIATLILHSGLDLGRHIAHLNTRVDHFLASHDPLGVAASLTALQLWHHIGTDGDRFTHSVVRSYSNLMRGLSSKLSRDGWAPLDYALGQLVMADGIELRVGSHEDISCRAKALTECTAAPRAHDLRLVEALSKWALLLKVDEELTAGIGDILSNSQAQAGKILDLKGLGEVALGRDGNDFVILVKVEEFVGLGQIFECGASPFQQLCIVRRHLEALGLTLVGDLHGFLCLGIEHLFELLKVERFLVNTYECLN